MTKNLAWPIKMTVDGTAALMLENAEAMWAISQRARATGTPLGEIKVTMQMLAAHSHWIEAGRTIYELTPELTAAFVETAFPLTGRDIDVPIPAFYISSQSSGLTVSNGKEALPLDGWYFSGLDENFDVVAIAGSGDGAFCHFQVPWDVEIEQWLSDRDAYDRAVIGGADINVDQFVSWVRVVIGTCAYLACAEPDVVREPYDQRREHRDAAGDKKKRLKDVSVHVSYLRVGTRERLGEFFSADDETRRLTRRFVVRGHYRRLAKKTVWVRPHWKGPDWGSVAAAHVVKVT